jgi:transposase InsO family protein
MDERTRLMAAVLEKKESMAALCKRFGISRKTGYKWRRRYAARGPAGLANDSRAPHRVPWAIDQRQEQAIVALRAQHRSWGPKKLRAKLAQRHPEQSWPAPSTIGELLKRRGLSQPRRRHRHGYPTPTGLTQAAAPNDVWCIDFKGWFRTRDGTRCDPLTVTDAFSRYLLCCRIVRPDYPSCHAEMERLFKHYGLPRVIRSDNGAPFASVGAGGLSRLAVGWIKLGIRPERIALGKPQQNGSHERMHQTLKAECANPPAANPAAQQCRFNSFRTEFNHHRPHEALGQTPPARHFTCSPRAYPKRLMAWGYPSALLERRVRTNGCIKWKGKLIFISEVFKGQPIGLLEIDPTHALAYFTDIALGTIDCEVRKLKRLTRREYLNRLARRAALLALHPAPDQGLRAESVTHVAG